MDIFSDKAYEARLAGLFEKHPSVQKQGFSGGAYKSGLEGMRNFSSFLSDPWKNYDCIHVAGTNGKGSVSSMLAAALSSRGLRVGLYTSPHIEDFRERMRIVEAGGSFLISRTEVWDFLEKAEAGMEGLSFFEITTGMAFSWFADRKVDVAVIETGLGGRLDSTNIITAPLLSVVTSIGLDHCALLGNTRAEIAAEKAGIFKSGAPALAGFRDSETEGIFRDKAAECGCPLTFADDVARTDEEESLLGRMDLRGPCQRMNLHTVACALAILDGRENTAVIRTGDAEALASTARLTGFRGRWERLLSSPEMICDIGHNPQALELNFSGLKDGLRPLFIVYGIMADKDLDSIAEFFPAHAEYILVSPDTPRALPAADLEKRLRSLRPELSARSAPSVGEGVRMAVGMASGTDNPLIYIGGSTFVVADAMKYLDK